MAVNRDTVPLEAPAQLQIATREQGTTIVIELAGELDLAGAPAVRQAMTSALARGPECVVLDLNQLAFIDSSGLHATIELAQRSAAQNARLVIIPGPRAIQRALEITGLTDQVPFIDKPSTGSRTASPQRLGYGSGIWRSLSLPPNSAGHPKAAGTEPALGRSGQVTRR